MRGYLRTMLVSAAVAAAASSTVMFGQSQSAIPRDDSYVTTHRPILSGGGPDVPTKDDPLARLEATRERFGGDFTPEFMEALMNAANEQVAQYGPAGRGAIKVAAGGTWTNIGPYRSNWIQNGLRVVSRRELE
jgi:hypothetical protein